MTRIPGFLADLSTLPVPDAIEGLGYRAIVAAAVADLVARLAAAGVPYDVADLESDPLVIAEEARAFRELLIRARINDAVRAVLLPSATGADLDAIAAEFGVKRRVVSAATNGAPAVMESDAELRRRRFLAPDGYAAAGPAAAYEYFALTADASIKDARAVRGEANRVDLVLLSREGTGTVPSPIVAKVHETISPRTLRPLTDALYTRSAAIVAAPVQMAITVPPGPDGSMIRARAAAGVAAYAAERHAIGRPLYRDGLIGAAREARPIEHVEVLSPAADVDPGPLGAVHVPSIEVSIAA